MPNNYDCPVGDIDSYLDTIDSECTNLTFNYNIDYADNSISDILGAVSNITSIDKSLRQELKNQHDKLESVKSNMMELYDIIKDLHQEIRILENERENN